MAKKFKVKTRAVINRQPVGSTIELNEDMAKRLAKIRYVEIIEEIKAPAKKESAPKKPAAKKSTSKKKSAETKAEK